MSAELYALVPEYALGSLPEEDVHRFEVELAVSPALAREVDGALAAFTRVVEALPPVAPDPAVRARLLRSVGSVDRFAPFLARIAALVDMTVEAVRPILALVDDRSAWEAALPGMEMIHFQAGPRFATADAGLVRLQPGTTFPRHRHLGPEVTLVLEGGMSVGDRVYGPGEVLEMAEGSVHEYRATGERDLVILTVQTGIMPVFDAT